MKVEKRKYVSPGLKAIEIDVQAVICQSQMDGNQNETYQEGDNWRMPTKEELELLHTGEKTDTDWTTVNGVKCKSFKGRDKYKDNIIYMPAAGYYDGRLINDGENGYCYCWSSTPYPSESNDYSWHLILMNGVKQFTYHHRDCESSVRAVLMETN